VVHVIDVDRTSATYGEQIAPDVVITDGYPGPPSISPAYDEDGNAYVFIPHGQIPNPNAPATSGKITVINTKTNEIERTITLPSAPVNIAFSPDGSLAYVGQNDTLSVVDTATGQVLFTTVADVSPDGFPNLVAVSSDGKSIYLSDPLTSYGTTQQQPTVLGNTISVVSFTTGTNTAAPEITAEPDEDNVNPDTGAVPVSVTTSDGDGDALNVFVSVQPSKGRVIVTPNNEGGYTVVYTPTEQARQDAGSGGPTTDTFVLTVSDAQKYQTTTVTVPITPAAESVTV
jgi:hypothetical protein